MQGPKHPVYLLTSVLGPVVLSDAEVVEIYKARWGIEVYHPRRTLRILLRDSLIDTYERNSKSSRDYPRKKKHKSAEKPEITTATARQRAQAKQTGKHS